MSKPDKLSLSSTINLRGPLSFALWHEDKMCRVAASAFSSKLYLWGCKHEETERGIIKSGHTLHCLCAKFHQMFFFFLINFVTRTDILFFFDWICSWQTPTTPQNLNANVSRAGCQQHWIISNVPVDKWLFLKLDAQWLILKQQSVGILAVSPRQMRSRERCCFTSFLCLWYQGCCWMHFIFFLPLKEILQCISVFLEPSHCRLFS